MDSLSDSELLAACAQLECPASSSSSGWVRFGHNATTPGVLSENIIFLCFCVSDFTLSAFQIAIVVCWFVFFFFLLSFCLLLFFSLVLLVLFSSFSSSDTEAESERLRVPNFLRLRFLLRTPRLSLSLSLSIRLRVLNLLRLLSCLFFPFARLRL